MSAAEKVLVTAFDPALPMGRHYLPPGVVPAAGNGEDASRADPRLIWVFGAPQEAPAEASASSPVTHGEVQMSLQPRRWTE